MVDECGRRFFRKVRKSLAPPRIGHSSNAKVSRKCARQSAKGLIQIYVRAWRLGVRVFRMDYGTVLLGLKISYGTFNLVRQPFKIKSMISTTNILTQQMRKITSYSFSYPSPCYSIGVGS